jgi:hypothetical protein
MTYPQQPPVMHGYSATPPNNDWAPPPTKKRGPLPWLVGALVVAVLGMGGLIVALATAGGDDAGGSAAPPSAAAPTVAAEPTTAAAAAKKAPEASDFKLVAKVLDKKCFGSAGCNVKFRLDLTYLGPALDPATTWLVIFDINGIEDAPQIGSTEVVGDEYRRVEELVQTASSKSKITLKVTSVEQG